MKLQQSNSDYQSDLWYKLQELIESPVAGIGGAMYGPKDYAKAIRFLAETIKSKPDLRTSLDVYNWLREEGVIASQAKQVITYEL